MTLEYVAGGPLPAESQVYVERDADKELCEGLKTGQFCYIFNARQTGKTSLRNHVISQLKVAGCVWSVIDLSPIGGKKVTPEEWYAGILNRISRDLKLDIDVELWYRENNWLPPLERFQVFIETIMLAQLSENIVIFVDEIDSVLSLKFSSDDFFAFIRACYNRRGNDPAYNRLTFCLLGVATPSALIADPKRTPFNIGQAIELTGLTFNSAKASLAKGLDGKVDNPEEVLREVIDWTQGQPFLTQKICQLIIKHLDSRQPNVEQIIQSRVINDWQFNDSPQHLNTISDRILHSDHADLLLGLYQKLLRPSEGMDADDSSKQMELRLSGLVIKRKGKLEIYNRIYEAVFNQNWVKQQLANLRPYADQIKQWKNSGQNESYLLRGQVLADALEWREGKFLDKLDDQYLRASQKLEKRENQQRINALEEFERVNQQRINALEESERVKEENQKLKVEKEVAQARRQLRSAGMAFVLVFSIILLLLFRIGEQSRREQGQQWHWQWQKGQIPQPFPYPQTSPSPCRDEGPNSRLRCLQQRLLNR